MDRRNAIKNIGLSFGALAVTPTIIGIMKGCTTVSSETFIPKFFSTNQLNDIRTIIDLILPPTGDGIPGASQLRLVEFVDKYLHGVVEDDVLKILKKGLESLIQYGRNENAIKESEYLNATQWDIQLKKYFLADEVQEKAWSKEVETLFSKNTSAEKSASTNALNFLTLNALRDLAVLAFKTNSVIGEEFLHYAPIPGQQKGCISLEKATEGKLHAAIGD